MDHGRMRKRALFTTRCRLPLSLICRPTDELIPR